MTTKTTKTGSSISAQFLKKSREYLKLKHHEMAEICNESRVSYTKYENEYTEPSGETILTVAKKLSKSKLIEILKSI